MPRKNPEASTEPSAPAVHTPSRAKYVTVASKLPMHIELQLCRPETKSIPGRFGSEPETVMVKHGAIYVIRGTGYPRGNDLPEGFPERPVMIKQAGYALTPDVPADWFAEWLDQNKDTDLVRNGLIKAHSDEDSLRDMALEHKGVFSGLEPLNPKSDPVTGKPLDPRSPRPLNPSIQVGQADRSAA